MSIFILVLKTHSQTYNIQSICAYVVLTSLKIFGEIFQTDIQTSVTINKLIIQHITHNKYYMLIPWIKTTTKCNLNKYYIIK